MQRAKSTSSWRNDSPRSSQTNICGITVFCNSLSTFRHPANNSPEVEVNHECFGRVAVCTSLLFLTNAISAQTRRGSLSLDFPSYRTGLSVTWILNWTAGPQCAQPSTPPRGREGGR